MAMQFGFFKEPTVKILIVTGASSTGKTTLSKALAEDDGFEFLDEAWLPMFLPVLVRKGEVSERLAQDLLSSYIDELANDVILCRRGNFRPGDRSSIWDFKSVQTILHRLSVLESRADAAHWATKHDTTLILALPEVPPFIRFYLAASGQYRVLLLQREDEELATEIAQKHWFSDDQLASPINNQPYTEYCFQTTDYYMPWWLEPDQFDDFIRADDHVRAMTYATFFREEAKQQIGALSEAERMRFITVDSRRVFDSREAVIARVKRFMKSS